MNFGTSKWLGVLHGMLGSAINNGTFAIWFLIAAHVDPATSPLEYLTTSVQVV